MERKIMTITIGKKYFDDIGEIKVLCFVERNYLVAKRPRCKPHVFSLDEFSKRFKLLEQD